MSSVRNGDVHFVCTGTPRVEVRGSELRFDVRLSLNLRVEVVGG